VHVVAVVLSFVAILVALFPGGLDALRPSDELDAPPREDEEPVRELAWFHDDLGALVTHNVVGLKSVSAYPGGSVISAAREHVQPLAAVERAGGSAPRRFQVCFEKLCLPVEESPPRRSGPRREAPASALTLRHPRPPIHETGSRRCTSLTTNR